VTKKSVKSLLCCGRCDPPSKRHVPDPHIQSTLVQHLCEHREVERVGVRSMWPKYMPGDLIALEVGGPTDPAAYDGRTCSVQIRGDGSTLGVVQVYTLRDGRELILVIGTDPKMPVWVIEDKADIQIEGAVLGLVERMDDASEVECP